MNEAAGEHIVVLAETVIRMEKKVNYLHQDEASFLTMYANSSGSWFSVSSYKVLLY